MNNLELYDKFRKVPDTAKKNIGGGRLKGMTDINPMWRIKTLTEEFGICGFGWYYEITDKWIETSMAKDEITANVKINLYVKRDNEWSKPIVGIGGSMLVANEKNGLYVNDECYKMALTDAISVACKSLGIGADVYWNKDNTKYNDGKKNQAVAPKEKTLTYREKLIIYAKEAGIPFAELAKDYDLNSKTTEERFKEVLEDLKSNAGRNKR